MHLTQCNNTASPSLVILCQRLRGLCPFMNLRVMPAGALASDRATQAGQASRGGARLKELPGSPGWRLGVGLTTQPYKKIKLITETGSYAKQSYNGSSKTTCRSPEDNYITWDDGSMVHTGQRCKEASALKRSLANPKKKVSVGCWNARPLYSTGRRLKL